ncbi:hypothetical protein C7H83_10030 [Tetragenococcus halophilus]|uniref:Type II toxin-antitoxin system PemK/MazF family toxin n=1 Tax=Tetragenococcus halophilus TaxID=51669 RepID=A0A3G5FKB9_TETHA|nr:type II toxin-antitoxin system PemK/MazF family toxin [Tetragenococcus halophilus]AYW50780.1 hypothetical protein C7H83_10030 [Tetragenococcus halophilus]GBD64862.1 hypothetical protein TEHD23766T_2289 [Tetragenococcus halophilus subsp. flandriensis]GMA08884.1 hypothetical protein GCM10025886_20350 [Tetragenococcus halophilus subsp. flandriensis]
MSNRDLIGQIKTSRFPYYNSKKGKMDFKSRPILIIGVEKEVGPCDLTILPVSSITNQKNIIFDYDIKLDINKYPLLSLKNTSYCRTSKVSTVSSHEVGVRTICNLKNTYPDIYKAINDAYEMYQNTLF